LNQSHYFIYRPHRFNNNGLLIIPASSTYYGQLFCPSSGALDCVTLFGIMHPRRCWPVAGNIVGALYHKV